MSFDKISLLPCKRDLLCALAVGKMAQHVGVHEASKPGAKQR